VRRRRINSTLAALIAVDFGRRRLGLIARLKNGTA
jgi:hypothetical protein